MNINEKIKKLYQEKDWYEDCGYWVQYRSVLREIKTLEELREESYTN